ncbi:hypothetical protein IMX26_10130 [Clostridium sp. 'deep sea']|uniref:hypothetical protein n=1 Tax=Clostridium sp. 'deep sea' TaxID=2779445 RepID=UPI001896A248|nr:hypothetical protein [Clostridium sp. 'deep sea']QOR33856.1 hypothetical protein IMX26_10130 [Clostridium sp. 'deep sea']
MKKIVLIMLMLVIAVGVLGCSKGATPSGSEDYVLGTKLEEDKISMAITAVSVTDVIGDRTQDNYGKENGQYFAIGSEIVKASDYEQIEISVSIENKSDKAMSFSFMGWSATLPDGYNLENLEVTGKLDEQIPTNYSCEEKIIIIKEKAIKAEKLNLTYSLLDYNEEWQQDLWASIGGTLTEKEYKAKYSPKELNFVLSLEKDE